MVDRITDRSRRKISVRLSRNTEPTLFTHILEFKEKLPESTFTNGHWISVYPTDLPFIDFDKPVVAYDEKKEKLPLVSNLGYITMSTRTKYLYFHLDIDHMFREEEFEFIKEFEFKV